MGPDRETYATFLIGGGLMVVAGVMIIAPHWERIVAVIKGPHASSKATPENHVSGLELRKRQDRILERMDIVEGRLTAIEGSRRDSRSPFGVAQPAWESRAEELSAQIRDLQAEVRHLEGRVGAAVHNVELQTRPSASSGEPQEVPRAPLIRKSVLAGSNSAQGDGAIGGAAAGSGRAAGSSGFVRHERRSTQDPWALVARALREAWERACKDGRLDDAHFRREVEVMQGFRAHRREGNFAHVDFVINGGERQYLLPTRTESYHATERYECTDTDRDAFIVGLDRLAYREGEVWHPGLARTSRGT